MLEIDSDEIKVNAGLTAWQQAVANVKAPVLKNLRKGSETDLHIFIHIVDYDLLVSQISKPLKKMTKN